MTDPTNMTVVTTYDTPDFAWEVSLNRGFAWVADGETGILQLKIVRNPPPEIVAGTDAPTDASAHDRAKLELAAFPNPSRGPATLSFSLPQAGRAALSVYDVAGRQLARVADEEFSVGRHELTWDARDASGRRVAAGVYLLRLEAGSATAMRRVVRLYRTRTTRRTSRKSPASNR